MATKSGKAVKNPQPVARQTPEARQASQAGPNNAASIQANFAASLQSAMGLARKFCSFLNPESQQPAITNWPTQLLGNRILSGSVTYLVGAKRFTHALSGFMPSRNLKTGKPEKGAVRTFRLAYESGVRGKAAGIEYLNFLTYCILSSMTGELPSPNRASGESTIKGSIAVMLLADGKLTVESATATNPETESSITLDSVAVLGILQAFDQNRKRVESTWTPRASAKAEAAGVLDFESLL